ncbi:8197_t:CDS:2, partial [Funneliformis geosporum]
GPFIEQSTEELPKRTRLSPYNGQLLISTGVPSLDDILSMMNDLIIIRFDTTYKINSSDNALLTLINVNELNENSYHTLLDRIRNVIEENHLNSLLVPPSNDERKIFLHSCTLYVNRVRSLEELNTCDAVVEVESFA